MWPSSGASGNGACTVEKCVPWVIPPSVSRDHGRRGVMKLFDRTTAKNAKTIFAKGFTDASGSFGTRGRYTGVLFFFKQKAAYEIDITLIEVELDLDEDAL